MGTGQFCTNPGLVLLIRGPHSDAFVSAVAQRFAAAPVGTLLSSSVQKSLQAEYPAADAAGAERLTGDALTDRRRATAAPIRCCGSAADSSWTSPRTFQIEAFGNASLVVRGGRRAASCGRSRMPRGEPDGLHLQRSGRVRRRQLRPGGTGLAAEGGTPAQRQDAHRRGGQSGDESWRSVSGHRPSADSRRSGFPHRCGGLPCYNATTMCGPRACRPGCATHDPAGGCGD